MGTCIGTCPALGSAKENIPGRKGISSACWHMAITLPNPWIACWLAGLLMNCAMLDEKVTFGLAEGLGKETICPTHRAAMAGTVMWPTPNGITAVEGAA
ncbi:unnamed protein product [Cuscuta campestris]|uniref:Uncharacterized protein n=1 Tax=Cuscuta campestris TaxID=132261 RepID=A0A484K8X5_9ASTE|nr:unnamed protein product [Cuscuta campestris]